MLLVNIFRDWLQNRRIKKLINKVYEEDQIIAKISNIFGVQFYVDWIGRLYGVVNPYIRDGKWDQSQVFEYTEQGIDTTEHAHQWIMQRMDILNRFIRANNLFDLLTYDIKRLDNNGNYLFVIQPITQVALFDDIKRLGKWCVWIIPTIAVILFIFFMIFK